MNNNNINLTDIVQGLVDLGIKTIKDNCNGQACVVDYVAIFSKDEAEYKQLESLAESLGEEVDKETSGTGRTFKFSEALITTAGNLELVKIRKPDATRPQRGAPDFKIENYQEFKEKYIRSSGNFTVMLKSDYEMIEIKGIDVLVYVPSKTLSERMPK